MFAGKESSNSTYVSYYKLTYIGHFWIEIKQKLPNIVNIVVKVLISKLSFCRLKLEIYLVLKNQCLSI